MQAPARNDPHCSMLGFQRAVPSAAALSIWCAPVFTSVRERDDRVARLPSCITENDKAARHTREAVFVLQLPSENRRTMRSAPFDENRIVLSTRCLGMFVWCTS